ncbi:hypothetical protein BP5796_02120 [Coleophoma crateriformis]|uniref:Low temperature requirement A n=1 Tax=Coleophoma crateriformis TaxID=565419 RepID=A0A3D8SXB6_9HELO|nr:hypothetical protein BP5796_02120 [Coleophoma crateriformis]
MSSDYRTPKKTLSTSSSTTSLSSLAKEKTNHDEETGGQRKLKLFESPLAHERATAPVSEKPEPSISISGPIGVGGHSRHSSIGNIYDQRDDEDVPSKGKSDAIMRDTPEFRRYEEATNIELFYDLFFVANLTTFTDVHEINGSEALKAYAGFFCILWFLWCQVSLFDVRFVTDSILERLGKACQFGVMIGLAVVGPNFDATVQDTATFRSLALILMFSRIILGLQYLTVLWAVWNYKNSKLPLALAATSSFVAAFVYFGTFFGFTPSNPTSKAFVVWYITAIVETIVSVSLSAKWEVLSFRSTHLVQRMSLLTLIILGEGIIGIAKSISTVVANETTWTAPLTLTTLAAVVIIYFIYMIYFDWLNRNKFGSVREEIWAFLHFPFHLALIVLVEAVAQFIVWRKVVEVLRAVNKKYIAALVNFTGTTSLQLAQSLTNVTNEAFTEHAPKLTRTYEDAQQQIYNIGNSTFNSTSQMMDITTLFSVLQDSIFGNFGIEPKKSKTVDTVPDPLEERKENLEILKLIYIYFFIAAGLTLILMNILNFISLQQKTRGDRLRIVINGVVGIILASLASLANTNTGFEFAQSAWVLPTGAITFVSVMALNFTKLL